MKAMSFDGEYNTLDFGHSFYYDCWDYYLQREGQLRCNQCRINLRLAGFAMEAKLEQATQVNQVRNACKIAVEAEEETHTEFN